MKPPARELPKNVWLPGDEGGFSTRNTDLAAALGTLGFACSTHAVVDQASGRKRTAFFFGRESLAAEFKALSSRQLIKDFESGQLERECPEHPLLDCLAGCLNRSRILDWLNQSHPMCLHAVQHGGQPVRMIYAHGSELPSFMLGNAFVTTPDLKKVAALGRVGCPLIKWEGHPTARRFYVAKHGHFLKGERLDALQIFQDYAARGSDGKRKLEREQPEHPFLYVMRCLENRDRLLDHLNREIEVVVMQALSGKKAFVRADASDAALARAEQHLLTR